MGLHECHLGGIDVGVRERIAHHGDLRVLVGSGQTVRATVLVHSTVDDHSHDAVPVPLGFLQPLEDEHNASFTPDEPVSTGVERLEFALRRQHRPSPESRGAVRVEHEVDTTREGQVTLPPAQSMDRGIQRDKG